MAFVEGCKHAIEVSIPLEIVNAEVEKVAADYQKKVRLPGFRPGKAPLAMIRRNFDPDIRQKVVETLIPRYLHLQLEQDQLKVVGQPDVVDVDYTPGEPLTFKAEFEVAPEFELGEYRGLEIPYAEPVVGDQEIEEQLEQLRQGRATYANVDPRPLEDGDFAVLSLKSIAGVDEPVESDEMTLEIGGAETLPEFSEKLRGLSPDDETDINVVYPDDYGSEKLAGKAVVFHIRVKGVRRKEVPELNDEFAQDMGDFRNVGELRDDLRKKITFQRERTAQQVATNALIEKLVDAHDFPVPQTYVDRQIEVRMENRLQSLAAEGMDLSDWKPDWSKLREVHGPLAVREVRASLLLGKIAERESIRVTNEEIDRHIEQIARREREPIPRVRKRLEDNDGLRRIANLIVTEKTMTLLFEQARKTAAPPPDEAADLGGNDVATKALTTKALTGHDEKPSEPAPGAPLTDPEATPE